MMATSSRSRRSVSRDRHTPSEDRLNNALDRIEEASTTRVDKQILSNAITTITTHAETNGLTSQQIRRLVDVLVLPDGLDRASMSKILGSLFPNGKVEEDVAVKVIACLGLGSERAPLPTQISLLKWLVMVFPYLESQKKLRQLYGVIFHYLNFVSLRRYISHLLFLLTTRSHVKTHRIQAILEQQRYSFNDQYLAALLQVYKDYYPDVIVSNFRRAKSSVFRHPDPEFQATLSAIQTRFSNPSSTSLFARTSLTKTRTTQIPALHTYGATTKSVTLEELTSTSDFVNRLEKIQFPSQMVSILHDRRLQQLFLFKGKEIERQRLEYWLSAALAEGMEQGGLNELLKLCVRFVRFTKECPNCVEGFLRIYLKEWDGKKNRKGVFELLIAIVPTNLDEEIMMPLKNIFEKGDMGFVVDLFRYYTRLLARWATFFGNNFLVGSAPSPLLMFGTKVVNTELHKALPAVASHIDQLCVQALQTFNNIQIQQQIFNFYDILISYPTKHQIVYITMPSSSVVYYPFFSGSASSVSRICGILTQFKVAFELYESASRERQDRGGLAMPAYSRDFVNYFNGFVMDLCNCLWRNRALNNADKNALGCQIPEDVVGVLKSASEERGDILGTCFSLTHGTAFSLFAAQIFRAMEDEDPGVIVRHPGPVTLGSLKQHAAVPPQHPPAHISLLLFDKNGGLNVNFLDFRVRMLSELERRGFVGLKEFLYSSMTSLMNRVDSKK